MRSWPRSALGGGPRSTVLSCSIGSSLLPTAPAADDVAVGRLALLARAVAQGRNPPGSHRMAAGGGRALAAAVGMVDRVHGRAAVLRPTAEVAVAAGLAYLHVLVVGVGERPDGGAALRPDHPHLARGQAQRRHAALLGHELDRRAGGAPDLAAAAGLQLDVV